MNRRSYLDIVLVLFCQFAQNHWSDCPRPLTACWKAESRLVVITYCFNSHYHHAVDKPNVKAAHRPDWLASLDAAELGILHYCLVLHEFTTVLADKGRLCTIAFLISRGPPNILLFRRKGYNTHRDLQSSLLLWMFRICSLECPELSCRCLFVSIMSEGTGTGSSGPASMVISLSFISICTLWDAEVLTVDLCIHVQMWGPSGTDRYLI